VTAYGAASWTEAVLRAANAGAPLALMLYWRAASVAEPEAGRAHLRPAPRT